MKDGGSAFPQHGWSNDPATIERMKEQGGMSLRDWFAGQIMAAYFSRNDAPCDIDGDMPGIAKAQIAYALADAMLKARETP
jgi:hypothetical protein